MVGKATMAAHAPDALTADPVTTAMPARPVILLLFANDRLGGDSHYLRDLPRESRSLEAALTPLADRYEIIPRSNVTRGQLFDLLRRYGDRTVGVHFGGHAHPNALYIEDEHGRPVALNVEGLAGRFAEMQHLAWVFLNGCATKAHAETIHGHCAATVIATERTIRDDVAAEFADEFYRCLAAGKPLVECFAAARDRLLSHSGTGLGRFLRPAAGGANTTRPPWMLIDSPERPDGRLWRIESVPFPSSVEAPTQSNIVGSVGGGSVGIVHGDVVLQHSPAEPPDDTRALQESVERYIGPIGDEAILGHVIPRSEAKTVIRYLESGSKRGVLVVGEAGIGKSGVIAQVVDHFVGVGWPIVALRLDRMTPARDVRELGEALRLSDSPTAALRATAAGRPCLVVVDQLDAVSAISGRNPDFFERVAELAADVRRHSNVRIVMGCRAFDLREDHRIRRLVHPKRGIATEVEVGRLAPDVIRGIVARAGRDPKTLTATKLKLFSLPFNLWLWTLLVEDAAKGYDPDAVDSARALLDRYWAQQAHRLNENHPRAAGKWLGLIDALLDYMGEKRILSAPYRRFEDDHRDALAALLSAHMLIRDKNTQGRVAFPHEAIFDYLFARRFIARGRDLLQLLRESEQPLSLRTTVRQVLQHMRSGDAEADDYAATLRSLLTASDVRFHVKEAVLAWLGELEDPRQAEWLVLRGCIADAPDEERRQWLRRTISGPWFDLLVGLGHIEGELACNDAARIELAVQRLGWAGEVRPEMVCKTISTWLDWGGDWPTRLVRVMAAGRAGDSAAWIDLYFALIERYPGLAREHLHHNQSLFFADLPQRSPAAAIGIAAAHLDASLRDWWNAVDRSLDPFEHTKPDLSLEAVFGHKWRWMALAEVCPAGFVEEILPMLVRAARLATRRVFIHPHKPPTAQWWWGNDSTALRLPRSDWIWLLKSVEDRYGGEAEVLHAAEHAIALVHRDEPDVFAAAIDLLWAYRAFDTPAFLLLRALRRAGPSWAEWTVDLLLDTPHLLNVGYSDASHWVARETIEQASAWCSPTAYRRLETLLLGYTTVYERTRWLREQLTPRTWVGRDGRLRWAPHLFALGSAQFTLLNALPPARRSAAVRRRIGELRRRFGRDDESGPRGIRGGAVGPPFTARWARISDAEWLNAMGRHDRDDVHGTGDDFLRGGASQLAGQLEARTAAEPKRFATLFVELPDNVNPTYADAILRGLAKGAKEGRSIDAESIWAMVRHAFSLPGRPCGRWTWDLIVSYAEAEVPDDILDVVVWYATQDPDPAPEDRDYVIYSPGGGEGRYMPDTHGLNSVRGGMCWAIEALLFADPGRLERLRPAIDSLVLDPSLAVRTQVPHALLPMLNVDADAAVSGFVELCQGPYQSVAATPIARHFLRYATQSRFDTLEPLLASMLESEHGDVRKEAAVWYAVAVYYRGQKDEALLETLWAADDAPIRIGLVEVTREVVTSADPAKRDLAIEILTRAFSSEVDGVTSAAARIFWEIGRGDDGEHAVSLMTLTPLIDAFIDSPAFEAKRQDLMFLLKNSGLQIPDVVLRTFERTLSVETKHRLFDTALIYRLYEDTADAEVKHRCLDLIDALLQRGDYELQRTLTELDGPVGP